MKSASEERIAREQAFHNERFAEETRDAQSKYYFAIANGAAYFRERVRNLAANADVLEYGCAKGENSLRLASIAKSVVGIDISDVAIGKAASRAAMNGVQNASFFTMNAEKMTFGDASFDLIFGSGIIHHLDIDRSMTEIRRVLRPGGKALFWEPLGHNPLINLYRKLTPNARTPDEHPLLRKDFSHIAGHFSEMKLERYGVLTLASVPFRNFKAGKALRNGLAAVDRILVKAAPANWWCWYVAMELRA